MFFAAPTTNKSKVKPKMKFNKTKTMTAGKTRSTNHEGAVSFNAATPEMALYKYTANNLLENNYYTEDTDELRNVRSAFQRVVDEAEPEFALKMASYARNEMGLRSISQLLLVLAANTSSTKQFVREYAPKVMRRADEPAKVVAMHDELFGGHLPQSLVKGINDTLHTFDEYQFAKYDSSRREYNLKDVLNRTHPKPRTDEHDRIFERLMRGELDDYPEVEPLKQSRTWESVISEKGSTRKAWLEALEDMGIFAKLRNVRNMREKGLTGNEIFDNDDLEAIRKTRMLPFRIYQSYKAVKDARLSTPELDQAYSRMVEEAMDNVPDWLGDSAVAADTSGSMGSSVSGQSNLTCKEIAAFFAAVAGKRGAEVYAFASEVERINFHSQTPVFELMDKILHAPVGGSTNGHKVVSQLDRDNAVPDRVIFLTDMQLWDSTPGWGRSTSVKEEYESRDRFDGVGIYFLDLQSYGDLQMPEGYPNVYNVSGWNSKILEFVEAVENPGDALEEVRNFEYEVDVPR